MGKEAIIKLDLGCGTRKREGFLGVDIMDLPTVDYVHDLNIYPWPFGDETVEEVCSQHLIEHVDDIVKFMDEIYRILKVGGKATITAPYYTAMGAWQDPTHKRAISEASFLYFNKNWRNSVGVGHYAIKSDFDFTYGYILDAEWNNRAEESRMFAIKHYMNAVREIQVTLTKRAPEKPPGE